MGFINILVEKSNKGSEMKWEFLVVSVLLMFVVFLAIKYQKESWKKALVYSSIVSFAFATAACAFSDIFDMVFSLASAFEQYIVNLECKRQSIGIIQEKISKGVG